MRFVSPAACTVLLFTALLVACSVDRAGRGMSDMGARLDAGADSAMPDAGPTDLGPNDLGPTDLGPNDLGMTDLGPRDLGPPDLGPPDLGPPDLGPRDLGPPDLGPRDLGPPDLGPRDLGPPDLGPPDLGPPSCTALYGTAPGFISCMEGMGLCEFYTLLDGSNCTARCAGLGGECRGAFSNGDPPNQCTRGGAEACTSTHMDEICVCSR